MLRRALYARGLRYRVHVKKLPGTPDIAFLGRKTVLFVHGCFWHRHPGCRFATNPSTRPTFWQEKFMANIARDRDNQHSLKEMGWRVGVVWECAIGKSPSAELVKEIEDFIREDRAREFEWP